MDNTEELRQLAHLLRNGAGIAREIVWSKSNNMLEICDLAAEAEQIAEALDAISARLEAADTPPPATPEALTACEKVFVALGDPTRLGVVARLLDGMPHSIARLTEGTALTRQAVTKHLHVLAEAGVVRGLREGRETLFQLQPRAIEDARAFLETVSRQWDDALARLKAHVEGPPG